MVKISARDLLNMDPESVWTIPDGAITLICDDIDIETTARRLIFCYYLLTIHRNYPTTPLLSTHFMGMDHFTSSTHLKLFSIIYKDCIYAYQNAGTPLSMMELEKIWKLIYVAVNDIYNTFIQKCDSYVTSMGALDFIEMLANDAINDANTSVLPTHQSINDVYDVIDNVLDTDESLKGNSIVEGARLNIFNVKQVKQCIGPRGFITEINSTLFKQPVVVGYAMGMRDIYDTGIESRSASKALVFAKDPLADCEYFNRRLQLLAQVVRHLWMGDCGSTHYMPWEVAPGELKIIEGMNYVEDGDIKMVKINDLHLVGKTIQMRTPFGCTHSDRQTICSTCFGGISYSIPSDTALGHVSSTSIGKTVTGLVLATKHHDESSSLDAIDLGEFYDKYLTVGADENTLRLSPTLKDLAIKIHISGEAAKALPDIYRIRNFEEIDVTRITEMSEVKFIIGKEEDEGGVHEMVVPVSMGFRLGSLSGEALQYIKDKGTELDENDGYIIDLSDWPNTSPLFELPLKHINMVDYMNSVASVILASAQKHAMAKLDTTTEVIKMLSGIINTKITVNLAHILVVAYSTAAVNPKEGDYNLPRGGEDYTFVPYSALMNYRSLGAKMAHQEQAKVFLSPEAFVFTDRPSHPIDPLLMGK